MGRDHPGQTGAVEEGVDFQGTELPKDVRGLYAWLISLKNTMDTQDAAALSGKAGQDLVTELRHALAEIRERHRSGASQKELVHYVLSRYSIRQLHTRTNLRFAEFRPNDPAVQAYFEPNSRRAQPAHVAQSPPPPAHSPQHVLHQPLAPFRQPRTRAQQPALPNNGPFNLPPILPREELRLPPIRLPQDLAAEEEELRRARSGQHSLSKKEEERLGYGAAWTARKAAIYRRRAVGW